MKYFLISLTALFISLAPKAQTAEDSVKATINTLFTAMKNADGSLLKTVFSENAVLQTIARNKEGRTLVKTESLEEFAAFIGKIKKDSADEHISFETVKI